MVGLGAKCKAALFAALFLVFGFFADSCVSSALEAEGEKGAESESEAEIFLPERFEEIEAGKTAATFKTSKKKAALYINGNFQGLTPLMAAGLLPGFYSVQIKKDGFKTVNIAIQVRDGVSDFYYIEMEVDEDQNGTVPVP